MKKLAKAKHKSEQGVKHEEVLDLGKTYMFRVIVEPDEDRWFAYCPALRNKGATTWGYTREEALKNINEVVQMIVAEIKEEEIKLPSYPSTEVEVWADSRVAVAM